MKVADVMSKQVDYVSSDTSIKDVARLIFGHGINGVPVCKDKKVIGFITERDILAKFYPSMQEYMEDIVHMGDFELMEAKVSDIFSLTAYKIMSKKPILITPDTELLRAHSLMAVNRVGRLAVVNDKGELVGLISRGDIFRAAVGDKLPFLMEQEYHDWLADHYDMVVKWSERLGHETEDLTTLFKKNSAKTILDIGCGTGEHDIDLARRGFEVIGIETSNKMYKSAMEKWRQLPNDVSERITFLKGDYVELLTQQSKQFDGVIFMGNAFGHLANRYADVLKTASRFLRPKNSLVVMQVINFEKVFIVNKGFLDFNMAKSKISQTQEYAFLEFYDQAREKGGNVTLNMAMFLFNGKKWRFRQMNSAPIAGLSQDDIAQLLRKNGFDKISFYGSKFWGPLFDFPFKPMASDWLNVVAKRDT